LEKSLEIVLNQLDLIDNNAVFFRNKEDGQVFDGFSSDINKKLEDIKPDAFYVFNKQPFILFFDLTSNIDLEKENEIHKKVWSFDNSPIIFVIKDADVKVYNALNFEKHKGLEEIKLSEEQRNKKFSFWNLQSGEAFEWFYEKHKSTVLKKRVNQQLFLNIKQTILLLKDNFNLEEGLAKTLVLRLIFIRYLIDRKIRIDNSYIQGEVSNVIERRRSLSELIANPKKLVDFFDYLNKRFNGVLFKNSNIKLADSQANILSKLFNPDEVSIEEKHNLFTDFDFQYDVFDFGIIPVELISGIYETLLDEETKNATSAVYTPPFLVDYILTETVDKYFEENKSATECKIFDPAMGSGIFLVQGLRRMIERELELNPDADNTTFGNRIREIAERNLFGIDINEEAIDVACFSIYVALLDYQEPGNIDQYIFPNLKDKNFFKTNFFVRKIRDKDSEETREELETFLSNLEIIKSKKIDFIIGNPPWKRDKSDYHVGWLNENNVYKKNEEGEKEIALSYLMRVNDFMTKETVCSLIVTSTIFYNVSETTRYVKNNFFETNSVQSILDLSPVRRLIFDGEKRVPKRDKNKNIVSDKNGNVLFKNQKIISPALNIQFKKFDKVYSENNPIHFKSIKANKFFNKYAKALVIEKFDCKKILQKHFIENQWMFKVALYGNTLDYLFLKRLSKKQSILNFLKLNQVQKRDGLKRDLLKKKSIELEITNIDSYIIEKEKIEKYYTYNYLKENTNEISKLFGENRIILKGQTKNESHLVISYSEGSAIFRNDTFVVLSDKYDVKILFPFFISDFYTYYQFIISSTWGIATRPAIRLDSEYLSFPFIEPSEAQKKKLILLVEDLLKPYKEHYKDYPILDYQGEPDPNVLKSINSIVEEIYQITGYEKDLIDYVLNVSRYQFQESKQHLVSNFNNDDHRNQKNVLERYADVYIQEFEKIYDDEFIQIEIYSLDYFIAMNFVFLNTKPTEKIIHSNKKDEKEVLNRLANSLSISQITNAKDSEHNLFIQKDIKGFEKNSFYIIKPNEYKCWHRAMAWYDVAEFKEAIQKAELERLNSDFHA
jgi:hypothetical protein